MTDVTQTAKIVLTEVARAKGFSETQQLNEIFLSSETIISGLAYLLSPRLEAEQAYRKLITAGIDGGMSAAAAEAKAKASDEYVQWKKLEGVYELGQEQINILKKFGPLLNQEYQRS
jgi:hypothetical protein